MAEKRIGFLFPGQGAQYVGMGKDFYDHFNICKEVFEEASELLKRDLSSIIFQGPEQSLTETKNSQLAIYVTSIAILKLIEKNFPALKPFVAAGLSLGEYTALTASKRISFSECLSIVQLRAQLMNEACEKTKGTMAVVLGLEDEAVDQFVEELKLPNDLWVANYNCPGQVVISGTFLGIEKGIEKAKEKGAKRVLPLQVHGAFHSGLMEMAKKGLKEQINSCMLKESDIALVMNRSGAFENSLERIKMLLIEQVTHSVRWHQGIQAMDAQGVQCYIEMGPGKTLAGMNKRIGTLATTISIEKIEDLEQLEKLA